MYLRPFARRTITFHTSTPCPIAAARDGATPRDHPSQGHRMARLQQLFIRCHAIRQMNVPQ